MDYQQLQQLENDLWAAADQLRANSKLTASEYSMPVLGLIFLRHATTRFYDLLPEVEKAVPARATGALREDRIKLGFAGKAAIYLPEAARYDHLAALPAGTHVGAAIRDAMIAIEASVTDQQGNKLLEGALPKDYLGLEQDLLAELVKIFNRPALQTAQGDVFGRIYEYFLNQFAQSGAQEGGEYFTPPSLVRMIVNVIEPDHGTVLDPACGSAGMFVQTGHFIEEVRHQHTVDTDITFYGQEKADLNSKLARMNLAVHGLEGQIRIGNTFYEDQHQLLGRCDFVMANPPFNVDGVDTKKIESQVSPTGRLPFGLPGTNGKTGAISNANSLWIQYFYSYLNATGRAGFVMASSASDAGNKDRDIREQLVKTGHVDAMVAIGNKFFYTRSLPCTLWFLDKGKGDDLQGQVLMLDARNVYTVVSARSHVFSEEQLANLNAIVWLYRGETDKYRALLARHQEQAHSWLAQLPQCLADDDAAVQTLADLLQAFADNATLAELNAGQESPITVVQWQAFKDELASALATPAPGMPPSPLWGEGWGEGPAAQQAQLDALQPALKTTAKALEARHKQWLKLLETAEKPLRARQSKAWDAKAIREAKRALQPADASKTEAASVCQISATALKQSQYFIHQGHWLHSRFPDGYYQDVPGLCKAVTQDEIAANDYSLTPGRYVGVAAAAEDDAEDFAEKMREIHAELAQLNDKAVELATRIASNFEELLA
ncbi:type I restriction-modification system subunit M [Comamonas badia]|uniref:type I restriction-modification system subunit M n=1 Tax=Comamonas badia TaxID=265291 RepID=UPI000464B013|nr:type I restriction-modification system subunit M [Comamonas badia]